jgi:hypothetical protein
VTSIWTIHEYRYEEHSDEYMDDANPISIHEQSECYTCKQYECNEYVRSALARSKQTICEAWSDLSRTAEQSNSKLNRQKASPKPNHFSNQIRPTQPKQAKNIPL